MEIKNLNDLQNVKFEWYREEVKKIYAEYKGINRLQDMELANVFFNKWGGRFNTHLNFIRRSGANKIKKKKDGK